MRNQNPFISIVITNKNAFRWLDKCLRSIQLQSFDNFEVVFVDNASTDNSVEFVEKTYPWVRVFRSKKDLGFASANNFGAKRAKGKYILLINTDAYLERNALKKLQHILKSHPEYHLAQLDEKAYDKTNLPDRYLIFNMDIFGYPIGTRGRGPIFYADGAALLITKSLFLKLNGFDDAFYMYLEDMDLSWRARLCGERVYFLKNIFVYHFAGGTSETTRAKKHSYITTSNRRFHAQKNNLRCILKNYSIKNVIWILPSSVFLASLEGFFYLFTGNTRGFIALHRAIWWNVVHLSESLRERYRVQKLRKVEDDKIFSIVTKTISKFHSLRFHGIPRMRK